MSATAPEIGWLVAFTAGLLSFLSPCVAPLVPGYLSFLASGAGLGRPASRGETERIVTVSLLFVLGFSTIFVVLGAGVAIFGSLLEAARPQLNKLAGLVMIGLGLAVAGVLKLPGLYQERRLAFVDRPYGPFGPLLLGMAFALGWTPCVGPVLAAILFYAGAAETAERGALLLLAYSAGLGLPFLAVGLGWARMMSVLAWARRHGQALNFSSAGLLVGLGLLFLTNRVFYLNLFAQRLYYELVR